MFKILLHQNLVQKTLKIALQSWDKARNISWYGDPLRWLYAPGSFGTEGVYQDKEILTFLGREDLFYFVWHIAEDATGTGLTYVTIHSWISHRYDGINQDQQMPTFLDKILYILKVNADLQTFALFQLILAKRA